MNKWLLCVTIGMAIVLLTAFHQVEYANRKWETAMQNIKAYDKELGTLQGNNSAYRLTIGQLTYYQDSILKELNKTRKQLEIKDRNLKALQSISSSFSKIDTIILKDTVFKEPSFAIDTVIGDEWYSLRLGLRFPSTLVTVPEFKSEKHIVVYSKKETVNPPKKFFLFRWLQKKHYVLNAEIIEKNPYVTNEYSKYIEIIK